MTRRKREAPRLQGPAILLGITDRELENMRGMPGALSDESNDDLAVNFPKSLSPGSLFSLKSHTLEMRQTGNRCLFFPDTLPSPKKLVKE